MNNYVVYMHKCPNGKIYIGITGSNVKERWNSGHGYRKNEHFFRAIKKYGWNNIKHTILFKNLTKEEAEQQEIQCIKYYKSNNKFYGYNKDNGGNANGKLTEETKKKISIAKTGFKFSKEQIEKKKQTAAKFWLGKKLSLEVREKMSKAKQGFKVSKQTKDKISKNNARYWLGKQRSDETKLKISENNSKLVICIENGNLYQGAYEAHKITGINHGNICSCCRGERKTAGGFHWKYKEASDE